jgi:hypothetical protein
MNVNDPASVELLYGAEYVPKFDYTPLPLGGTKTWQFVGTFRPPKWGPAGFGNPYNYYVWSMKVFDGKLFVGTAETSYLAADVDPVFFQAAFVASGLTGQAIERIQQAPLKAWLWGSDLVRFDSTEVPAVFESVTGLGNYRNTGIRTMVSDGKFLYMGTENSFNISSLGGWEVIKLIKQ